MATDDSTRGGQSAARPSDKLPLPQLLETSADQGSVDPALTSALSDAIEDERSRLMRVESLIECLLAAMDNDDDAGTEAPYYPNVIEMMYELVQETIDKLDSVNVKPLIRELITDSNR